MVKGVVVRAHDCEGIWWVGVHDGEGMCCGGHMMWKGVWWRALRWAHDGEGVVWWGDMIVQGCVAGGTHDVKGECGAWLRRGRECSRRVLG